MTHTRFLDDLNVLGVGVTWMVVNLALTLNTTCLNHKVWVLWMATRDCIFECRISRFTLLLLRIKVFHFEVGLAIHSIDAARLLRPFLLVQLLVHVLEQLVFALLLIGALERFKPSHKFDIITLRVSMLRLYGILTRTIVTVWLIQVIWLLCHIRV